MTEVIIRYVHFIGIMLVFSTLISQHILITKEVRLSRLRKITAIDKNYRLSLASVLISGFLLLFLTDKSSSTYLTNIFFHLKIIVFLILIILAIFPTLFFLKQKNTFQKHTPIPQEVLFSINVEIVLLLLLPLLSGLSTRL